jgi:pyruvate/2-oxoglutarate/acetoin dehydrogenase E1 component
MRRSSTCGPPSDGPADGDRKRAKTGRLVTVEEGFPQSSVGTEIATRVQQQAFDYLDAPVITIAGKDVPMPYAANLEKLACRMLARSSTPSKP